MDTSLSPQYLVADTYSSGGFYLDAAQGMRSPPNDKRAPMQRSSSVTSGLAVYSRTMGIALLIATYDAYVELMTVPGGYRYAGGALSGAYEVLAATLTRPQNPNQHLPLLKPPAYLWTVERRADGGAYLVLRSVTFGGVSPTPIVLEPLTAAPGDFPNARYALETAWDQPSSVLLTISHDDGSWALLKASHQAIQNFRRLLFDGLLNGGMYPEGLHLFRGIYAEDGGVVIPLSTYDQTSGRYGALLRRRAVDELVHEPELLSYRAAEYAYW